MLLAQINSAFCMQKVHHDAYELDAGLSKPSKSVNLKANCTSNNKLQTLELTSEYTDLHRVTNVAFLVTFKSNSYDKDEQASSMSRLKQTTKFVRHTHCCKQESNRDVIV